MSYFILSNARKFFLSARGEHCSWNELFGLCVQVLNKLTNQDAAKKSMATILIPQVTRNACAYSFYIALSVKASRQYLMYIYSVLIPAK